jgi:hypothetical protein
MGDFLSQFKSKTVLSAILASGLWLAQQPNPKDMATIAQAATAVVGAASVRQAISKGPKAKKVR